MKITEFLKKVAEMEGKKKQVNIAQIAEVLKCVNKLSNGQVYKLIKQM